MTTPTQRPASTSDARKRLAERGASATLVAELIGCKGCRNAGITAPAEPDADEREALAEALHRALWGINLTPGMVVPGGVHRHTSDAVEYAAQREFIRRCLTYVETTTGTTLASRTPDAHLAAAKAEACHGAPGADHCPACPGPIEPDPPPGPADQHCPWHGDRPTAYSTCSCARAARLREQCGGEGDE